MEILRANLDVLRRRNPRLAARVEAATAQALTWETSKAGLPIASMEYGGQTIQWASRYDPMAEAMKLLSKFDPGAHGGLVLLGMGLGYAVKQAAMLIRGEASAVMVFEPRASMVRAVMERIDCRSWLMRPSFVLLDGESDRSELMTQVDLWHSHLTQGTVLVTHPVTSRVEPEAVRAFAGRMSDLLAYSRTHVATALVNSARTYSNLTMNLGVYAAGSDTDALHKAAAGCPAVCVGAGPSLAKNVDLLRDPAVRRRIVLISAQTTLKPLLQRGIEPDFVTALDYSPISTRFYEDLPPLPGVTLVAEPLAHPSILDAFPGPVRVTQSTFLHTMLGELAKPMVPVPYGATVAHLSFYLAQHLACDPIILIGQDLGFSDGLYYAPGTSIHDVWAGELNAYNTLEMLEWQRIVRHRPVLSRREDVNGQPIYTDEQMMTYLKQFERDFAQAKERGTTVIDATEGGLPKADTTRLPLREALARYATKEAPRLPLPPRELDTPRLRRATDRLASLLRDVGALRTAAQRGLTILADMLTHQDNSAKMRKLFEQLDEQKAVTQRCAVAFELINQLNSFGGYRRVVADRRIGAGEGADALARQRAQIERDQDNLRILVEACDETTTIFSQALERMRGQGDADARLKGAA